MEPLAPGQVISGLRGRFRVEARCGEGGFGQTFRAVDEVGRVVALKQLRFERLRDWKALELFEREGRVLERLRHPSIPAYIDFFAHDGVSPCAPSEAASRPGTLAWVIAQEFVEGPTLQQVIDAGSPLPPAQVQAVLRQLLEALVYLHGQASPVIHRDINPKNIVLHPSGRVYLVDFGAIQDQLRAADAHGSTTVGTLGYMPLEQLRGSARPASDLYALGMTVLAAASGSGPAALPVDEASGKVRVAQVLAGWPAPAQRAVDRMVEPLLGARVASAAEALRMLDEPVSPPMPVYPVYPVVPVARPAQGGAAAAVVGALTALSLAGAGAAFFLIRTPPSRHTSVAPPVVATTRPGTGRCAPGDPLCGPDSSPAAVATPAVQASTAPVDVGRPFHLVWPATLVNATGVSLSGSSCTMTTDGVATDAKGFGPTHVVVTCGRETLYDNHDPFNGSSSVSFGFEEMPAAKPGQYDYTFVYSDMGARTGRAQATMDTRHKQAVIWRDTVPVSRVQLVLRPLTLTREPLLQRNRTAR